MITVEDFEITKGNIEIAYFRPEDIDCSYHTISVDAFLQHLEKENEIESFDPHWIRIVVDYPTYSQGVQDGIDAKLVSIARGEFLDDKGMIIPLLTDMMNQWADSINERAIKDSIAMMLEQVETIEALKPESRRSCNAIRSCLRAIAYEGEVDRLVNVFEPKKELQNV